MREIKFRAWVTEPTYTIDKEPPYMLYDAQCCYDQGEAQSFGELLKTAVVMQYTGLKDSQNREIYEGDIVTLMIPKFKSESGKYIIKWHLIKCAYRILSVARCEWCDHHGMIHKVYGNIYENPELLERD